MNLSSIESHHHQVYHIFVRKDDSLLDFLVEKNSFKFDTYKGMVKDEAVRKISARIREECYLAKGKTYHSLSMI